MISWPCPPSSLEEQTSIMPTQCACVNTLTLYCVRNTKGRYSRIAEARGFSDVSLGGDLFRQTAHTYCSLLGDILYTPWIRFLRLFSSSHKVLAYWLQSSFCHKLYFFSYRDTIHDHTDLWLDFFVLFGPFPFGGRSCDTDIKSVIRQWMMRTIYNWRTLWPSCQHKW